MRSSKSGSAYFDGDVDTFDGDVDTERRPSPNLPRRTNRAFFHIAGLEMSPRSDAWCG